MNLVQTSLAASVMILLVLLLRGLLLYRWPKKAFAALWMLVLLRLLLPFQWQAPWQASLLQAPDPVRLLQQDAPPAQAGDGQQGQEGQQTRQLPWHLLWAAGAAGCGVFWLTVYRRGRRRFSMALPVENPSAWQWLERHPLRRPVALRQTDQVEGPLTYGLFRPVILLPKALASAGPQLLECVLAHEWTHIRRWDAGKKLLLAAGLCLHWFNPLVWVFFFMANRDLELACDEGAIALLGGQQRGRYARTLIQMEEVRSGLLTPFGGNRMKERVKAIMKGKNRRRTMVSVVPAGMLLALVALALSAKPGLLRLWMGRPCWDSPSSWKGTRCPSTRLNGSRFPTQNAFKNWGSTPKKCPMVTTLRTQKPTGSTCLWPRTPSIAFLTGGGNSSRTRLPAKEWKACCTPPPSRRNFWNI